MNVFIPKARLCSKSIPRFDKDYKDAQIEIRRLKKIWNKKAIKEIWETFKVACEEKCEVIAKVKKGIL